MTAEPLPLRDWRIMLYTKADLAFVKSLHASRRDTLARMQEHGLPDVVLRQQERMIAEVETALRARGEL